MKHPITQTTRALHTDAYYAFDNSLLTSQQDKFQTYKLAATCAHLAEVLVNTMNLLHNDQKFMRAKLLEALDLAENILGDDPCKILKTPEPTQPKGSTTVPQKRR